LFPYRFVPILLHAPSKFRREDMLDLSLGLTNKRTRIMKSYCWMLLLLLVFVGCGGGETGPGEAAESETDVSGELSDEDMAAEKELK